MKIHVFITVRTDSSRLPQKALLPIRGRSTIEHIIDRAKTIREVDDIVLCTSDRKQDNILEEIALKNGIKAFRGSLEDKLDRWRGAAQKFNSDYFLTVDGDDIFCDPELCELAIEQIKKEKMDFLRAPNDIACGAFTYGISRKALEKVCEIKDSSNTEMMWVYFTDTGLFKVADLDIKDKIFLNPNVRLTLDYPEDLDFFKRVFEEFDMNHNFTPLRDILIHLEKNPHISAINFFRQQAFLDNQKKKTTLKLKVKNHEKNTKKKNKARREAEKSGKKKIRKNK